MVWSVVQRRRYARLLGYFIGIAAGVAKLLPAAVHLTPETLGHVIGIMLIVGGVLGAWAQYAKNISIEVAGLWLLAGALGMYAVGVWAAGGLAHLHIALIFVAASFLFLGRIYDLNAVGHRLESWRKRRDN